MTNIVSSIPYRKIGLFAAGALALVYALSVLSYVPWTPDIGLRCAFTRSIQFVDARQLTPESEDDLPEVGDSLVRVGKDLLVQNVEGPPRLWAQVLLLRSLINLRSESDSAVLRTTDSGAREVRVEFRSQKDAQLHAVWCRLGHLPLEQLIPSVLWFFLKLGLFAIGALVFWKRPTDASAAQFFLLCIVTLGAYVGGYHWTRIATHPTLLLVFMVCGVLLPAVSLHFYLVFPRPKEILLRRPGWTLAGNYALPLAFLAVLIFSYWRVRGLLRDPTSPAEAVEEATAWLRLVIGIYLQVAAAWYLASLVCLGHSYWTAQDRTERNQVKWIFYGSGLAVVPIGYTLYLISWKPDAFGDGAGTWPMFATSAFITVAFAVSITRYRLMQLDQLVSSGAVYFLISIVAGLVYYGIVFIAMVAADLAGSHILAGTSLSQTLWVSTTALVLLLLLNLVRTRITKALDYRFNRTKYQLDRTLRRMGQAIDQLIDPPTLARRLLQASAEILNVSQGAVYLREGNPPLYRLVGSLGPNPPPLAELSLGCPLVESLLAHKAVIARPGEPADAAQRQLRFLGGEVAYALAHENQVLAFLLLGAKDIGYFSGEDLSLLASFAQFTVLALESARGHRTIEILNQDLRTKVEKISEQQRRILALQTQLMKGTVLSEAKLDNGDQRGAAAEVSNGHEPAHPRGTDHWQGIIGSSPPMRQLLELVRKVSASESAVLIQGESGTGKELLARAIHEHSARAGKPYVKVHCTALSPGLLESELFGHVQGAFTTAHRDKVGRFELAHGGTLFLDEIGDISLEVQTKLLRVIQDKTFERVGSSDPVQVNVRILAATHQNLEELIRQGRFRQDFYYRLKVIDLTLPSLRQRREDIPELALHFLHLYNERHRKAITEIEDDALALLKAYPWPGNIRQLENIIQRAVVFAEGPVVTVHDLPAEVAHAQNQGNGSVPATPDLEAPILGGGLPAERQERSRRERERLVRALAAAGGNKAEAARALGLARSTLLSRLKKYGLS
jgi:transcriptional regulator with GAF, ATPase, and Fis domain